MRYLLLAICAFCQFSVAGQGLDDYVSYSSSISLQDQGDYQLVVDNEYTALSFTKEEFVSRYLASSSNDQFLSDYLGHIDSRYTLKPFKPALSSYIVSALKLKLPEVKVLDASIDVGYLWLSDGGVVEGAVILVHAYTPITMGRIFHKKARLIIGGDRLGELLAGKEGLLERYVIQE